MTRRSEVYLEVPERKVEQIDQHSLHISISGCQRITACKAIGVKIHRRSCQKQPAQLGATKSPNKTSCENFAARFRARALKLLIPPSYEGYRSWGHRQIVSLFGFMNGDQTKLQCDAMVPMRILKTIHNCRNQLRTSEFPIRFCFPRGYFFLFVNWGLNEQLTHSPLSLFLFLHRHFSDGHQYDHRHISSATSHGLLFLSRV